MTDTPLLTPEEVATRLRTTRRHVYNLIKRGDLKAVRIGVRAWRIPAENLDALIARGFDSASC